MTVYWEPVFGSIQNEGVVWKLPDSEVRRFERDVALGHAEQRRLAAIDIDLELRMVEDLVHAQVNGTRYTAHPLEQQVRVLPVGLDVEAGHLHIERGRQTEIQDLTHDVRGREREQRRGVNLREFRAQRADVVIGRVMVAAQSSR